MKLAIVGAGRVGLTLAFAATVQGLVDELVLVGRRPERLQGEAMDLFHATAFLDRTTRVTSGGFEEAAGSNIVVVAASAKTTSRVRKRTDLARENAAVLAEVIPKLRHSCPEAIVLVVSNPVDAMTFGALRLSGFPSSRVLGVGTVVDSARYRRLLATRSGIHPVDLRAYMLGEHGDEPIAIYGGAFGDEVERADSNHDLAQRTIFEGHEVRELKGTTTYAVALATSYVIASIVNDARHTLPLSVLLDGQYGLYGVCLSLPVVVGRGGAARVLTPELTEAQRIAFRRSAEAVQRTIDVMEPIYKSNLPEASR